MGKMTKTEKRAAVTFAIIGFGALAVTVALLALFIFKSGDLVEKGLDRNVYFIILVVTGISFALFVFGVLKSSATYQGKTISRTLTLGGPVVGALLIIVLGIVMVPEPGPFDYTFWVQDANGRTVLQNQGSLRIRLGDRIETREIDENGSVTFKQIPRSLRGKTIQVELEAPRWLFENGQSMTECEIKGASSRLIIKQNTRLFGTIIDEEGNGIEKVKISVGNQSALTGQNGYFEMFISPELLTDNVLMNVSKEGYETITEHVSPGSPQEIRAILKKTNKTK